MTSNSYCYLVEMHDGRCAISEDHDLIRSYVKQGHRVKRVAYEEINKDNVDTLEGVGGG
jgi:hypothetical protein